MQLLYINEIGTDYKLQKQYEFVFGKDLDVLTDEWYFIPASGRVEPPDVTFIDLVGLLKNSEMVLELVQDSEYFGMIDAVDGIIALGWEPFDIESEEDVERICFHFGEDVDSVKEKLASKGLSLIKEDIKYKFQ